VGDEIMVRMFLGGQETHVPATVRSVNVVGRRLRSLDVDVDDAEVDHYGIDNPVPMREPYIMKNRIGGRLTIERIGGAAMDEIEDVVDGLLDEQEPPDDQPLVQRGMALSQHAKDIMVLLSKLIFATRSEPDIELDRSGISKGLTTAFYAVRRAEDSLRVQGK